MKIAAKIIAGCVWLGLVVLFSIYGGDIFSSLADWTKRRIFRAEMPPALDFAITIIPWNVFISLLLCLPLWFMKTRRAAASTEISGTVVFFFLLLAWNIIGIANLWIFFPDAIGNYSGTPSLSVIEPYAIKEGWSPFGFWCAWWGFILVSNLLSMGMALVIVQSRKSKTSLLWS